MQPRTKTVMSTTLLSMAVLQVLTMLIGLGRSKGLALLLGPAHFGVVGTIDQLVTTVAQLGAFALPLTALKFMARSHSEGQVSFQRTSASFVRALALLTVFVTMLASVAVAWNPGVFGADLARYRFIIQLALLGAPAVVLNMLFVHTVAAAARPAAAASLNLLVALGLALAAIVGVKVRGMVGLYIATVVFSSTALVASVAYLRRSFGLRLIGPGVSIRHELRRSPQIVPYAAYLYLAMSAYGLSMLAIRVSVFSRLGEAAAGLLQLSLSIALTVGAILTTMSNLYLTPLVNREAPVADKVRAANDFAKNMLGIFLLCALPVVLFPRLVVGLLYTREFAAATATVFLFVLWQCVFQVANVYQQLLIGLDDVLFMSVGAAIGYGSAALIGALLISHVGLGGAAIGLTAGMFLYGVLATYRLRKRHRTAVPVAVMMRALAVVTIVAVAGRLFGGGVGEFSARGLSLRLGFAVTAIGGFWLLLGVDERAAIAGAPAALRRRLWDSKVVPPLGPNP